MVRSETDFADSVALPSKTPLISSLYALTSIPLGLPSNVSSNATAQSSTLFQFRVKTQRFLYIYSLKSVTNSPNSL